jgi:hypothetical protein
MSYSGNCRTATSFWSNARRSRENCSSSRRSLPEILKSLFAPAARDLAPAQPRLFALIGQKHRIVISNLDASSMEVGDILEVYIDRGSGFRLLAPCAFGGAIDITPFPLKKTLWTYKAIYRVAGDRVGRWSAPVSLEVSSF